MQDQIQALLDEINNVPEGSFHPRTRSWLLAFERLEQLLGWDDMTISGENFPDLHEGRPLTVEALQAYAKAKLAE